MRNAFRDLYYAQNYAGILGLGLVLTGYGNINLITASYSYIRVASCTYLDIEGSYVYS